MKKEDKDILLECLLSLEKGITIGQAKGLYTMQNSRILVNSIEKLNEHLMSLKVDEPVEGSKEKIPVHENGQEHKK